MGEQGTKCSVTGCEWWEWVRRRTRDRRVCMVYSDEAIATAYGSLLMEQCRGKW